MDLVQTLRAVFALCIVIGLILGLTYLLRRYAPQLMATMQAKRGARRLEVIETLVLDPARRLVLVRLDQTERLILLGEGRELQSLDAASQPQPAPATTPDKPFVTPVDPNDDLF
ncbi:MAG: flagellar biosynthetic protein FliO [Asticcacaulis sp.]